MNKLLRRGYRFKSYLNASHYIIIDGIEGQAHPHTWEFMLDILIDNDKFIQFDKFEKAIDNYFSKYQNKVLNTIKPFDHMVPTLENMTDYFVQDIRVIIRNLGGEILEMESSETPTRSYVVNFEYDQDFIMNIRANSQKTIEGIIDSILDNILE